MQLTARARKRVLTTSCAWQENVASVSILTSQLRKYFRSCMASVLSICVEKYGPLWFGKNCRAPQIYSIYSIFFPPQKETRETFEIPVCFSEIVSVKIFICFHSVLIYLSGIRYIRLRSLTGVEIPHSGLFVRMKLQDFQPATFEVKGTSRERLLTFQTDLF